MSLKVGELYGTLDLDDKKFNSGLNSAHTKFSSFGSKIGAASAKIGKVALMGAAGGIAAMVAGLGAGVVAGMKFNSSIEQTTIAMGTMLGSTDKAKTLIAEVTKMAAATPFEFPELADATKRLVAYGVAAGDAVPLMTRLGDISSALQIPIGELADLYGKMKVSGKITMEDMNQMAGRGIPIYAALAKTLGVGEEKIRGLVETGKVGFPDIEKAIVSMTDKGSMFGGMMDKQSRSFAGLWSTIKDGVTQAFGKAVTPLFTWLVEDIMPKAIKLLDKINEGISADGFMGGIRALFAGVVPAISEAIPKIWAKLQELGSKFIEWIGPRIPDMIKKLVEYRQRIFEWIIETIPIVASYLGQLAVTLVEWIVPQIPAMLAELGKLLLALGTWIVTVALPAIVGKLEEWARAFVDWITPRIPAMLAKLGELLLAFGQWFVDVGLPAIVAKLSEWAKAFADWIGPALPGILVELAKLQNTILTWIVTEALPKIVVELAKLTYAMTLAIGRGLAGVLDVIKAPFVAAWVAVSDFFTETFGPTIKTFFSNLPGNIKQAIGNLGTLLKEKGEQLLTGLWDGIKWVWSSVSGWFLSLANLIVRAVGDLASTLKTAGETVMAGFLSGAKRHWAMKVLPWFSGLGAVVKGIMWAAMQLHSPSRITYEAGVLFMQGFANGIQDGYNDWVAPVLAAVVKALGTVSAGVSSWTAPVVAAPVVAAAVAGGENAFTPAQAAMMRRLGITNAGDIDAMLKAYSIGELLEAQTNPMKLGMMLAGAQRMRATDIWPQPAQATMPANIMAMLNAGADPEAVEMYLKLIAENTAKTASAGGIVINVQGDAGLTAGQQIVAALQGAVA